MNEINFSVLFILGLSIFGGLAGASITQKFKIPQVVGYILMGLIVGESGFKLVSHADVLAMQPFTVFALGIIGFLVGGELKIDTFKKYGKQFCAILLGEGVAAFVLVGGGVTLFLYGFLHDLPVAIATGVVFGAIASATDPASTIDVLWEYRSLGILTTSLTAIVALDDALAMTLYGIGTGVAEIMVGSSGSILKELAGVGSTLIGAVLIGVVSAIILKVILRWLHHPEKSLAFAIGLILLIISLAVYLDVDVILTTMSMGCVLTNTAPRRSENLFKIMRNFSVPIYVVFFVLAGARLGLSSMPGWLWILVVIYVVGRSVGKMVGAYAGARYTGSKPEVRRYLGMGLFAQGGVAIGLSIMASHHLAGITVHGDLPLSDLIMSVVAATTLIVQLAGPPMVKLAIKLGGEIGRNITAEDVINSWAVENVMDKDIITICEDEPLKRAAQIFSENDYIVYPVINKNNSITGVMSLDSLKEVLDDQQSWSWLVASDVSRPVEDKTWRTEPLRKVLELMNELQINQMPVVESGESDVPVGIIDITKVKSRVNKEMLKRRGSSHL